MNVIITNLLVCTVQSVWVLQSGGVKCKKKAEESNKVTQVRIVLLLLLLLLLLLGIDYSKTVTVHLIETLRISRRIAPSNPMFLKKE